MFIQIDSNNGIPVYEQVIRQITFAVANGALRSGEMIPSVRQLARELAINPNTVARAFRELQSQNILEPVRGTGMQVASGAKSICKTERQRIVRERLGQVIEEAQFSQLTDDEILQLFQSEHKKRQRKG